MAHHSETSETSLVVGADGGDGASPLPACCLPLHFCTVHVTIPKYLVAVKCYHYQVGRVA